MGLTESKIKDLHDKKFDKLYDKHQAEWQYNAILQRVAQTVRT